MRGEGEFQSSFPSMPSKKQRLAQLKGDWTAAKISVSFKPGVKISMPIINQTDAYLFIASLWDHDLIHLQEQFMAVYLNTQLQVIGYRILNTGDMASCHVDVRLLVSLALHCMASSVIVAHNHPSGALTPSDSDKSLTTQIKQALALINVKLHDHLIISVGGWLSMARQGLL
jgi:DNA repair protein RadC